MKLMVPTIIGGSGFFFIFSDDIRMLGILMLVISISWFFAFVKLMPTDQEIDETTFSVLKENEKEVTEKLKNSYDNFNFKEPIKINNYSFKELKGVNPLVKKGRDKKIRSSFYTQSMFMFTDDQIIHQQLDFSIIHPTVVTFTEEYYYDDLVTVKSHESSSKSFSPTGAYEDKAQFSIKSFELITKGGNNVTFSFRNQEKVDEVVEYMKTMIRKRKTRNNSTT